MNTPDYYVFVAIADDRKFSEKINCACHERGITGNNFAITSVSSMSMLIYSKHSKLRNKKKASRRKTRPQNYKHFLPIGSLRTVSIRYAVFV